MLARLDATWDGFWYLRGAHIPGKVRYLMSWTGRLKWAASRVPKRTADAQLMRLIDASDLEGANWRVIDERAWTTGTTGPDSAWAARAKAAGLITAWRSLEEQNNYRWLWVQASPLASPEDAREALRSAPQRFLTNLRSEVTVVAATDVEPIAISDTSAGWAHEQRTQSRRGDGETLYCGFVLGSTVAVLSASGLADSWSWTELGEVARKQAERLTQ